MGAVCASTKTGSPEAGNPLGKANGCTNAIAVYIDADNISWKYAPSIHKIVQTLGTIRKAIAIGEEQRFKGRKGWHTTSWVSSCPINTVGKKKNATDFEMTIRMGEDVVSRRFDIFCIVADDNDYLTAAERLRVRGVQVFGIGQGMAPETYRKALNGYYNLAELEGFAVDEAKPVPEKKVVTEPVGDLDGYCDRCFSPDCRIGCVQPEYGTRYCQWALAACGYLYRHARCSFIADRYWKRVVGMICGIDELTDRQREQIEEWVLAQDKTGGLYRDFVEFARKFTGACQQSSGKGRGTCRR